jgi:hypothetical protein
MDIYQGLICEGKSCNCGKYPWCVIDSTSKTQPMVLVKLCILLRSTTPDHQAAAAILVHPISSHHWDIWQTVLLRGSPRPTPDHQTTAAPPLAHP